MKFKDKDGNVFEDIKIIWDAFCRERAYAGECHNICPLNRLVKAHEESCLNCAKRRPAEAARLMGYEVMEDEPEREASADNPCKWCKDEICVNADSPMCADYCPAPDTPGVCRHEDRSPRFTGEEAADAKVLAKALLAERFERNRYEDIYLIAADGARTLLDSNMFPSIRPGQSVRLSEIVGGAE